MVSLRSLFSCCHISNFARNIRCRSPYCLIVGHKCFLCYVFVSGTVESVHYSIAFWITLQCIMSVNRVASIAFWASCISIICYRIYLVSFHAVALKQGRNAWLHFCLLCICMCLYQTTRPLQLAVITAYIQHIYSNYIMHFQNFIYKLLELLLFFLYFFILLNITTNQ